MAAPMRVRHDRVSERGSEGAYAREPVDRSISRNRRRLGVAVAGNGRTPIIESLVELEWKLVALAAQRRIVGTLAEIVGRREPWGDRRPAVRQERVPRALRGS